MIETYMDYINYVDYCQSISEDALKQNIQEAETELKALGEMYESARLGYAPHGPSMHNCEVREAEIQSYLKIEKAILEVHHRLRIEGLTYVKDTLQFMGDFKSENKDFACKAKTQYTQCCFLFINGRATIIPVNLYHNVRRYFENHADDYNSQEQ